MASSITSAGSADVSVDPTEVSVALVDVVEGSATVVEGSVVEEAVVEGAASVVAVVSGEDWLSEAEHAVAANTQTTAMFRMDMHVVSPDGGPRLSRCGEPYPFFFACRS